MTRKQFKIIGLQLVFTLFIFLSSAYFFIKYDSEQLHNKVDNVGQSLAYKIQEDVNIKEGILASFGYNYEIDPNLDESRFRTLAEHYLKVNSDILYIQRKDKETTTVMVYPETYNYTLGATLKGRPEVEEAVQKAIEEKRITANSPFILKDTNGLLGLVIRYPLYYQEEFNGFFVVVMSVDGFLNGIVDSEIIKDYNVSFFDDKGNLFWGEDKEQSGYSYKKDILILDNHWTIKVSINKNIAASTMVFVTGASIIFLLVSGLLIYMQVRNYRKDQNIQKLTSLKNEMEYMAYYDSLTELANKERFMKLLKIELDQSNYENNRCSILMLDLDNFKRYNDTLGFDFCDQLLKEIGRTISTVVGKGNLTARFGGDEFLILLRNTMKKNDVEDMCRNIIDVFKHPFKLNNKSVYMTISIGVVCCLDKYNSVIEYMRTVDLALNKAKENGKNQYCFFDDKMHADLLRNSKIETCIREAIKTDKLMIHYQLQQSLSDEKITGVEALARLTDDELGVISPLEFIQIAENTGLIVGLGNWILKNACLQGKMWLDSGYQFGKLSVNISSHQLKGDELYKDIKNILTITKFPPEYLELEITESILFNTSYDSLKTLFDLKALGLKIALDDFGTGYSSLNYLTVMPIDTLKIDKTFVNKAYENIRETQVIRSIIELAHNLNLQVVAEGVETKMQKEMLKNMNCNSIQGYYFARPMSAADVTKLLD